MYTIIASRKMNDINNFIKHIFKSKLLILGFVIYFSFNISALKTSWFDYFFFGNSIHYCCKGLDFYQVPNAMYAFLHGGDLSGNLPKGILAYSYPYVGNYNVYHPLLTIILGGLLILFNPDVSIVVWSLIKIVLTLSAVYYIYENFKGNKYLNPAIFLLLTNFSQYNEIKLSQYQFLFNIFLLYFLINIAKNKGKLEGGILFFLTLIAKPISLLWLPVLIFKRKVSITLLGLSLLLISTLTFNILGFGHYFIDNVKYHLLNPVATRGIDFMSLDALLRYTFNLSTETIRIIKLFALILIYAFALKKSSHVLSVIFLLTVYFLFFYDFVFQYHFSVLGPLLSVCLLVLPEFQTRIAKILILIINLPTIFFILRFFKFQFIFDPIYGPNPTMAGWQIVSLFQVLPILLLVIIVLVPEIKFYLEKFRINKNVSV